mmetsp:Transcript_69250/g.165027  ORF Transcript_69250/g.165027 Transcript_69250/m.165027 type:complete len:232 (-) Transcript_69250:3344-4039(-)
MPSGSNAKTVPRISFAASMLKEARKIDRFLMPLFWVARSGPPTSKKKEDHQHCYGQNSSGSRGCGAQCQTESGGHKGCQAKAQDAHCLPPWLHASQPIHEKAHESRWSSPKEQCIHKDLGKNIGARVVVSCGPFSLEACVAFAPGQQSLQGLHSQCAVHRKNEAKPTDHTSQSHGHLVVCRTQQKAGQSSLEVGVDSKTPLNSNFPQQQLKHLHVHGRCGRCFDLSFVFGS